MKYIVILWIIFCCSTPWAISQTYKVFNPETEHFPLMKAQIWVTDSAYKATKLSKNHIQIFDNKDLKLPIEFKAPSSSIIPSSMVLVLDISGSMQGIRFEILKQTIDVFLQNLPMESTEIALAAFSDNLYLLSDFTHDRIRLNKSLTEIFPEGGTNFNKAFLGEFAGALDIAKSGKNKRVVIFLTDGLSKANYQNIAKRAILDSTQINCITIGLPINEELIYISKETNGNYFSDLNTAFDIQKAFETVYHQIQEKTYGYISWIANPSCQAEKETQIIIDKQTFNLKYTIPENRVGSIEVAPESVVFETGKPNVTQYKPIFLKGNNIDLQISNLTNTNDTVFGHQVMNFPFTTTANQWKTLYLSFTPRDSIYSIATYTIQSKNCPNQFVFASSSGIKKLQIIEPYGDEVFPRNTFFKVVWKGIDPNTPVDLFYQTKGTTNWQYVTTGSKFSQEILTPPVNDNIRILGQITNNITLPNLLNQSLSIFGETTFISAQFNETGSEILSQTEQGVIQTWDAKTGNLLNTFERPTPGLVGYSPKFNRVAVFSEHLIILFTNRNGMLVKEVPMMNKKMFTSFLFIDGKEFYTSALSPFSSNFWDVTFNYRSNNLPGGSNKDAAMTPNGKYIAARREDKLAVFKIQGNEKWMSVPISPQFQKAVFHHSENMMAVDQGTSCELFHLETKLLRVKFPKQSFLQYEPSGKYLLTNDSALIYVTELETGVTKYSFPVTDKFLITNNGQFLAYQNNDSLYFVDINLAKIWYCLKNKNLQQFKLYPSSYLAIALTNDSLKIIDFLNKKTLEKVKVENRLINHFDISPDEKYLLITTPKLISVWVPGKKTDSDTSAYFQIISPYPKVVPQLVFEPQWINQPVEKVFYKSIGNSTKFPITIDSMVIDDCYSPFELVSAIGPIQMLPNEEINIELRFTPVKLGETTSNLRVFSGEHQFSILLKGAGLEQSYKLLTPQLDFGALWAGNTTDSLIPVLTNNGNTKYSFSNIKIWPENSNFFLNNSFKIKELNPGDTLWITIGFRANVRGKKSGVLKLDLDQIKEIVASEIFGTGLAKRELVIAGRTLHSQTLQPLKTLVQCTELSSKRVVSQYNTTNDGTFTFEINTDLNYSITAQCEGYFSSSENIDLVQVQLADTLWCQIFLTPIETNSKVVLNNIFFEFGKSELLDISQSELKRLVQLLILNPGLTIQVHGHTDFTGTAEENMILSKERALAVKQFLEKNQIGESRVELKYFGETKPIATNETDEGRKANRRVEVIFIQLK